MVRSLLAHTLHFSAEQFFLHFSAEQWTLCCGMLREKEVSELFNIVSGPEIGFPGFDFGLKLFRTASKSARRADSEPLPERLNTESGPENQFPARKHCLAT